MQVQGLQHKTLREKKRSRKRSFLLWGSLLVIIASFILIMNNEYLMIDDIHLQGQKTLIEEDILEETQVFLSGKYFWILPKNNIFLFQSSQLEHHLKEAFPKISQLEIELTETKNITMIIGERSAHSLWCLNKEYETPLEEECYFADTDGFLYARAPYFSGDIFMKFFFDGGEYERTQYIGENVFSYNRGQSFDEFFTFLKALESEYNIHVFRVYFNDFGDVTMKISYIGDTSYRNPFPELLYNQRDDYALIFRNIGVAFATPGFKHDFEIHPQNLTSLDVRFDGRVFYAFTPEPQ